MSEAQRERCDESPFEGQWVRVADRRYKVICAPTALPHFVYKYSAGSVIAGIVAGILFALFDRPPYAVYLYSIKGWPSFSWRLDSVGTFGTLCEANACGRHWAALLHRGLCETPFRFSFFWRRA